MSAPIDEGLTHASVTHRRSAGPVALGVVANLATLTWGTLVVLVAGRGFGVGNEGFYLLSYEYWDRDLRTFTGAQYLFGPLFDALGHDVAGLRVLRLVTVVSVHLLFGIAFARWLRPHRPNIPLAREWGYAIASVIVLSAAVVYSWLPATPGYNDVTMLGSMLMVGALLLHLHAAEVGRPGPRWPWIMWGLAAGAMVLAKPPVIAPVLLIAAVSAYALRKAGARVLPVAVSVASGAALFAVMIQILVLPWSDIVPPMLDQLRVLSSTNHSLSATVAWYAESSFALAKGVLVVCAPTAIAAGLAFVLRRGSPARGTTIVLVGLAASVALVAGAGGLRAGAGNVLALASGISGMVILVVGSAVVEHQPGSAPRPPTVVVVGLLAVVPALQGFGTNNALYAVAVNGAAFWVALAIFLVTRLTPGLAPAFALGTAAAASAVLLTLVIGIDGITHDASHRSLVTEPMARVAGVDELATIELPASEAATFSRLRAELGIRPSTHRPMVAFGELAHYVLVLGGRPIGTAWYSGDDDGLNAADLRAACRHGNPWGDEQPLVVATRAPSTDEVAAWRSCGIDWARDYADVTAPSTPDGVKIFRRQPHPGP